MPAAETARLIASLEMDDRRFRQGAARTIESVNRIDRRLGAFSGAVNRNLGRALDTALSRGITTGFHAIQSGIDSLVQLENATTSVDGAIKQMGLTGQVTSDQIAQWANEIEAATEAAFDDKAITASTGTLIRYGKVTNDNIRPAMEVMTDLAARTGSVESASTLLAKALADPTKAAGKLSRQGVILTEQQKKQIEAFVKAGKVGKAQRVIIDALAQTTENAARDAFGPAADAQHKLADAWEDGTKALATGFLPLVERVSNTLTTELAKPETIARIKSFGDGLAGAFGKALDFAEKIPWDKVGAGLGAAADFAGKIVGAFTSMPPEVQGTIIALAGLNKLSGGAVSGIVGELGKGLIKGVLGMTAGVVNINAGVVNGGGPGLPGGGTQGPAPNLAPMGLLSFAGVAAIGASIGTAAATAFKFGTDTLGTTVGGDAGKAIIAASEQARGIAFGPFETLRQILAGEVPDRLNNVVEQLRGLLGQNPATPTPGEVQGSLRTFRAGERESWTQPITKSVDQVKQEQARAAESLGHAIGSDERSTRGGLSNVVGATNAGASRVAGAFAANRPIVTTNVEVNVTATSVQKQTTTSTRYGSSNGSAGGGTGGATNKYD